MLGHWLARKSLATPPSVWGKLPSQGDFVHHRAGMVERQAWQAWVEANGAWPEPVRPARKEPGRTDWLSLDVARPERRLHQVPIAFVMPPGSLPFAPTQHVQGVMLPSADKVGRACPFIIYQKVSPLWLRMAWQNDAPSHGMTLMYWWARLAWQAVGGDLSLADWLQRLDALWAMHEPGIGQWLGANPPSPDEAQVRQVLGADRVDDPAIELRGVYHLPWADWPERVLRPRQPVAAFWTQDAQGGYVQAATSLQQLWGRA
jgi:type VI secretion system protein ImpM